MKIVISPSKTQNLNTKLDPSPQTPLFIDKTNKLVNIIKSYSKEDLGDVLKIQGKLLDSTHINYKHFYDTQNKSGSAISSYRGEVFKQLDITNYAKLDYEYIRKHLYILSALYGCLRPFDRINLYRLDMTKKILPSSNLYKFWEKDINSLLSEEDFIINLASTEFSKLVTLPMINVHFLENKGDEFKNVPIYSKKARGLFLNYMIKNKINSINSLKLFKEDYYNYNSSLSSDNNLYFTR